MSDSEAPSDKPARPTLRIVDVDEAGEALPAEPPAEEAPQAPLTESAAEALDAEPAVEPSPEPPLESVSAPEPEAEPAPEVVSEAASETAPAEAAGEKAPEVGAGAEPAAAEPGPAKKKKSAKSDSAEPGAEGEEGEEEEEADTPFEKLVSRAKHFSAPKVKRIVESLLLVSDKPLPLESIRLCTGIDVEVLQKAMEKLQGIYRDGVCGIVLHEVAGGWQFRTCPTTSDFVRRFLKVKPQRLTRAALETLAIIAYRQPVTRPEVEEIRAVDCGAVIKALLERQLIKIIGKKEEVGRPLLYGTTTQFLEFFNLKDLASLPTLREFQELSEEHQQLVEKELGEPEKKGTDGLVNDLRDNKLEEKLQASTVEADAALADLETAIADTDEKSKATARVLNPVAPPDGLPVPPAAAAAASAAGEAEPGEGDEPPAEPEEPEERSESDEDDEDEQAEE